MVQVVVCAVPKITRGGSMVLKNNAWGGSMVLKMGWVNALEKSGVQVGQWF